MLGRTRPPYPPEFREKAVRLCGRPTSPHPRSKARPLAVSHARGRELRVRHDKIDKDGSETLRYRSKLHHIGMGRAALKGTRVILLAAGRDVRVPSQDGELLHQLQLDPGRDYEPQSKA
jgi:hypothetical protein